MTLLLACEIYFACAFLVGLVMAVLPADNFKWYERLLCPFLVTFCAGAYPVAAVFVGCVIVAGALLFAACFLALYVLIISGFIYCCLWFVHSLFLIPVIWTGHASYLPFGVTAYVIHTAFFALVVAGWCLYQHEAATNPNYKNATSRLGSPTYYEPESRQLALENQEPNRGRVVTVLDENGEIAPSGPGRRPGLPAAQAPMVPVKPPSEREKATDPPRTTPPRPSIIRPIPAELIAQAMNRLFSMPSVASKKKAQESKAWHARNEFLDRQRNEERS